MSEELELKYAFDEGDADAVAAWLDRTFPPTPEQTWHSLSITDRYFDTADGALSAAGYGARLRRIGRRTTLTIKSDIEVVGGLHRRLELEGPAKQELSPDKWRPSQARDRLLSVVGDRNLIDRFVIRQRRRERELITGGSRLLASIDVGIVLSAGINAGATSQFEVERLSGRRAALDRVARLIDSSGLGRPEPRSKLAIAAEMSAAAGRVRADDQYAEAGRKVLRRHLLRMFDREIGTRAGDELALKQMRVATRRMRATWRVFADAYKGAAQRRFVGKLRNLGRALGEVRDRDVLIASLPKDSALRPVAEFWRAERADAYRGLLALLDAKREARFIEGMLSFTAEPGAGASKRTGTTVVADTAPGALREAVERMRAAGEACLATDDVETRHALRIEARRTRYSIEAFGDVLAEKPARALLRRVTRVQDHLGAMQDAAVAIEAVASFLGAGDATVTEATTEKARAYIERREAQIRRRRESFAGVWAGIAGLSFDRELERALEPLTER